MSPLVSGRISVVANDGKEEEWPLSQDQLKKLTYWLLKYRSSWNQVIEPSIEKKDSSDFDLNLIHTDGGSTIISFWKTDGKYNALIEGEALPDQSFNILKTRFMGQEFSEVEIVNLRTMLDKN